MVVNALIQHMEMMPAEEERTIIHALVDSIEIHPKPLPSGLILKRIRFRIPLDWDGYDSPIIGLDITDDDSDGNDPPSGGGRSPDNDFPTGGGSQPDENQTPEGNFFCTQNSLPNQTTVTVLSVTRNSTPASGVFAVPSTYFWIVRVLAGML